MNQRRRGTQVNKKYKVLTILFILFSFFITTGFTDISTKPQTVYRVYLKGKSLGVIASKDSFENYIDKNSSAGAISSWLTPQVLMTLISLTS